jgi:hypothetical protein
MNTYSPDKWQIVKLTHDGAVHYRVFGVWYGGYTQGDSWKLNSGIVKAALKDEFYHFEGSSGSIYVCHKNTYGTSSYGFSVLSNLIEDSAKLDTDIEVLPEETNFLELKYE